MSQVNKILANGGKDENAKIGFTHDCTKLFNSRAYFHTIELENMSCRNPKVGSNTNKRFIHFNLVIGKDARKAKKDKSIFEIRAKPLDSC